VNDDRSNGLGSNNADADRIRLNDDDDDDDDDDGRTDGRACGRYICRCLNADYVRSKRETET